MPTILKQDFFFKDFIYLLLERGKGRERNINMREIHQSVASRMPPIGDPVHNPGMCPDWESNWQPFGLQAGTQSIDPHQPVLKQDFDVL